MGMSLNKTEVRSRRSKDRSWTNSIFVRNEDVTELRCSALRAENGGLRSFTTGQLSQPIMYNYIHVWPDDACVYIELLPCHE